MIAATTDRFFAPDVDPGLAERDGAIGDVASAVRWSKRVNAAGTSRLGRVAAAAVFGEPLRQRGDGSVAVSN